jgi:protein TonB
MATENVIPYVNEKSATARERSLKIALVLSVLAHGVLGAYLSHWQPQQKPLPPTETKIQLKLTNSPLPLPQQVKPEMTRVPQFSPASQPTLINPVNQPVAATAPVARKRGPAPEITPVQTIAASGPTQVEIVEASPAPAARANSADVIAAFLARLEQRKEYPYIARKRGQTGTVTVQIRIAPDGALRESTVVASSGVARLDEAALTLVRQSCPFRHETGEELRLTVPIVYDLKE